MEISRNVLQSIHYPAPQSTNGAILFVLRKEWYIIVN